MVGVIIGKLDDHKMRKRGYIAMLAVDSDYRGKSIGTSLVNSLLSGLLLSGVDEVRPCLDNRGKPDNVDCAGDRGIEPRSSCALRQAGLHPG